MRETSRGNKIEKAAYQSQDEMIYFLLFAVLVLLDQLTKYWFAGLHGSISIIGGLSIVRTEEHPALMDGQFVVDVMSNIVNATVWATLCIKMYFPNRDRLPIVGCVLCWSGGAGHWLIFG
jgi:hypothetical protein